MSTCFAKKIKVLQIKNVVCLFPDSISCIESHCLYLIKRVAFASILGCSELKWPTAMKKDWRLSTTVAGKFGIQTSFTILLGLHLIVIWVSTWLSTAIARPFSVILDIRLQHRWAFAVVSHTLCKKTAFRLSFNSKFCSGWQERKYQTPHYWPIYGNPPVTSNAEGFSMPWRVVKPINLQTTIRHHYFLILYPCQNNAVSHVIDQQRLFACFICLSSILHIDQLRTRVANMRVIRYRKLVEN